MPPGISEPIRVVATWENWRAVWGRSDQIEIEVRLSDGRWVYPDCTWVCDACDMCLGCVRKVIYDADAPDQPLHPWWGTCPMSDTGRHEPRERTEGSERNGDAGNTGSW